MRIAVLGIDLGKNVCSLVGLDENGAVVRRTAAGMTLMWYWTITGPYCRAVGINISGDCATIGEARQAFRAAFDRWHAWAIRQNAEVSWHE